MACYRLGVVAYLTHDYPAAADLLGHALAVVRDVASPDEEAEILNHLGTLHRLTQRADQARDLHRQALELARSIHYRLEEAPAQVRPHAHSHVGAPPQRHGRAIDVAVAGSAPRHSREVTAMNSMHFAPGVGEPTAAITRVAESQWHAVADDRVVGRGDASPRP